MDVVTFGESMVLFVPQTSGPLQFASEFRRTFGGAESNVSIALSRLGHQVGWFSRLGNDEFGLYIRNVIRGEGVDTSRVIFDSQFPTAVFFKEKKLNADPRVFYYRKGSAASMLQPSDLDDEYLSKAKILHLTGITPALSDSCRDAVFHAIDIARKHGLKIVFDPNIRLKLWSKSEARTVLSEIIPLCDVVLPGLDEGQLLTGEDTPKKIASALLKGSCRTVIIKLGEQGAYYAEGSTNGIYVPGFEVKHIADTVGAGDGFAAGVISGMLRGLSWEECVRLGNRVGACALSVEGDMEGYPYWAQVQAKEDEILR